jgi:hypothetical protein
MDVDEGDMGESDGGVGIGDIMNDDATEEECECWGGAGLGDSVNITEAKLECIGGVGRGEIVSDAMEEECECVGGVDSGDIVSDAMEEERECAGDSGLNALHCPETSFRGRMVGCIELKLLGIFTGGGRNFDRGGTAGGRFSATVHPMKFGFCKDPSNDLGR